MTSMMDNSRQKKKSLTGDFIHFDGIVCIFLFEHKFVIMKIQRAKLENVKLREDLNKQNKKLEEMFEVLQKQIQNLARNLDKQVVEDKDNKKDNGTKHIQNLATHIKKNTM